MPKILIRHREESIAYLYKEEFNDIGFDSNMVTDCDEALYLLSVDKYDLVLLGLDDYTSKGRLTITKGVNTYKRINKKYPKLPVITVSSFSFQLGFLLSKGIKLEDYVILSADVKELLDKACDRLRIKKTRLAYKESESPNSKIKLFICYAKKDFIRAHAIYRRLKEEKLSPWIDREKLIPGEDWEFEIENAIDKSNFFLACLSRYSVTKEGYVQKELKKGLEILDRHPEGRIYLIPVRFDKCKVPKRFEKLQWCDLFNSDGMTILLTAIAKGCRQRKIKTEGYISYIGS